MQVVVFLAVDALSIAQLACLKLWKVRTISSLHNHVFKVTNTPRRLQALDQLRLRTLFHNLRELFSVWSTLCSAHGCTKDQHSHRRITNQFLMHSGFCPCSFHGQSHLSCWPVGWTMNWACLKMGETPDIPGLVAILRGNCMKLLYNCDPLLDNVRHSLIFQMRSTRSKNVGKTFSGWGAAEWGQ